MRTKKVILMTGIIFIIGLFAGGAFSGSAPQWIPKTGTEHNMVAYGTVYAGVNFSTGGYELYSFGPGGDVDCRSKSAIGSDGSYYATIVGDKAGEKIVFKILDAGGKILDLDASIVFEPDVTKEKFDLR